MNQLLQQDAAVHTTSSEKDRSNPGRQGREGEMEERVYQAV